jgi:hypothetical protein
MNERGVNACGAAGRTDGRTCGGADAAERDDPLAGDPEVVVLEEAAPFAAQALHAATRNKNNSWSVAAAAEHKIR